MTNIINNMQNMNMEMINMFNQIQMMNQMNNQAILNSDNNNNINKTEDIFYVIFFMFDNGEKKFVNISKEKTVEELLTYFIKDNNLNPDNFKFLFNGSHLNIKDKRKIKDYPIDNASLIYVYELRDNPA